MNTNLHSVSNISRLRCRAVTISSLCGPDLHRLFYSCVLFRYGENQFLSATLETSFCMLKAPARITKSLNEATQVESKFKEKTYVSNKDNVFL